MFSGLKKAVQKQFASIIKNQLFQLDYDKDLIWQAYLRGFSEELKQEHTCNSCKDFIRRAGSLVYIKSGKKVSIWDNLEVPDEYKKSVENLKKYVKGLKIKNVFLTDMKKAGVDKNISSEGVVWTHLFGEFPAKFVSKDKDSKLGTAKTNKNVLKSSLGQIQQDSIETVLELIGQKSIYRGAEFKELVSEFLKLKKKFEKSKNKDLFCWDQSTKVSQAICKIKNSAIGTLLLEVGTMDLDTAVSRYEKMVAPTNYKRTTALITPKMVQQAKDKLAELGYLDSIERRIAKEEDIDVNNVLFTDQPSTVDDVFDEMSKEIKVNPKKLSKMEEIGIGDFLKNVVPNATSMEVLLENKHFSNFVTLLTSKKECKSLFKWNNNFSWAYTGDLADSNIKQNVEKAGGSVTGDLRFSIQWNDKNDNNVDLDAHCNGPDGHIFFSNFRKPSKTASGGQLDIDIVDPNGKIAVENITWPKVGKMEDGRYIFKVHKYSGDSSPSGFTAQIEMLGEVFEYSYERPISTGEYISVAEVTLKDGKFSINHKLPESSASKEKWGLASNSFVKVEKLMLTPNHWDGKIGNKHFVFALEGATPTEEIRPFFNEQLDESLRENRKVFEVLGNKMKIKPEKGLAGLGFSETKKDSAIVRVKGKFQRLLKVNF